MTNQTRRIKARNARNLKRALPTLACVAVGVPLFLAIIGIAVCIGANAALATI